MFEQSILGLSESEMCGESKKNGHVQESEWLQHRPNGSA